MKYIIKPFSEIIVKSKPVRKRYLNCLQTNCNLALKKVDDSLKVRVFWDKLELSGKLKVESWKEEIIKILGRMPGIESFLEVVKYDFSPILAGKGLGVKFENIVKYCLELYKNDIEGKTFVVRVKRAGNHNFKSIDLERYIGGELLQKIANSKVDLHNPDFTLNIEIKDDKVFFVKNKYVGIGGFPVGTQDKVLSLISGGFDSSVSSYLMIKRGCKVDYLFFNLGGKAHEFGVKQVANHIRKNFSTGYRAKFITIPFEEVVSYLVQNINHRFRGIILKRLFLKVADILGRNVGRLNRKMSEGGANVGNQEINLSSEIFGKLSSDNLSYYAIVKGDSLGQVSSQTLKNMFVIDKASETLVLRPLISFNKQEIIDLTRKIGTYEFACNIPEYCGVISDKPATGAKLEQVLEEEKKIPFELLEKAIINKKIEFIDKVLEKENLGINEVEVAYIPGENEVVIDLREEPKEAESPLKLENVEILRIPFFDISYDFEKLNQNKTYLFYCDKGILSKNFALALREKGFKNIKIFKPILEDNACKL